MMSPSEKETTGSRCGQCVKSQDPPITRSCSLPSLCEREKLVSIVWGLEMAWGSARYHTRVHRTWPVPITTHYCLLLVTCTFNVQHH